MEKKEANYDLLNFEEHLGRHLSDIPADNAQLGNCEQRSEVVEHVRNEI
jgi:hypothetical protein